MTSSNVVAFATDAALFPATIFAANRLASLGVPDNVEIIVFSDSLRDLKLAQEWGAKFTLKHLDLKVGSAALRPHASFYRLFLPGLCPGVDKILYLDSDTYAENETVWRIFDLDLKGNAFAAVRDYAAVYDPQGAGELAFTGCADGRYLNSGVLLMDVRRYIERDLQRKVSQTAGAHAADGSDRDQFHAAWQGLA